MATSKNFVKNIGKPLEFNQSLRQCWQALQAGRTIAVYKSVIDLTGDLKTAVFLSQLIYWTRSSQHVQDRQGWIFKTVSEMTAETGLTTDEQRRSQSVLINLGLLEYKRQGIGARRTLKVNLPTLITMLCERRNIDTNVFINSSITELNTPTPLFRNFFNERITYHRDIVSITGCIHAAIMLSIVLKESVSRGAMLNEDEYFYAHLTTQDWAKKIILSAKSQLTARKKLKNLSLIIETHFYSSTRIYTMPNGKEIFKRLGKLLRKKNDLKPSIIQRDKKAIKLSEMMHADSNPETISSKGDEQFAEKGTCSLPKRALAVCRKGHLQFAEKGTYSLLRNIPMTVNFSQGEREILEVGKWRFKKSTNGDSRNLETEILEQGKSGFLLYTNYKGFNYNYSYKNESDYDSRNVVVVNDDLNRPTEKDTNDKVLELDSLIIPKSLQAFKETIKKDLLTKLIDKNPIMIQSLLDEIAGRDNIKNPLAYFRSLIKQANTNRFEPTIAIEVSQQRKNTERLAAIRDEQFQKLKVSDEPPKKGAKINLDLARESIRSAKSKSKV